jgi:ATP-dependent RNA helicase DDX24/MAK5
VPVGARRSAQQQQQQQQMQQPQQPQQAHEHPHEEEAAQVFETQAEHDARIMRMFAAAEAEEPLHSKSSKRKRRREWRKAEKRGASAQAEQLERLAWQPVKLTARGGRGSGPDPMAGCVMMEQLDGKAFADWTRNSAAGADDDDDDAVADDDDNEQQQHQHQQQPEEPAAAEAVVVASSESKQQKKRKNKHQKTKTQKQKQQNDDDDDDDDNDDNAPSNEPSMAEEEEEATAAAAAPKTQNQNQKSAKKKKKKKRMSRQQKRELKLAKNNKDKNTDGGDSHDDNGEDQTMTNNNSSSSSSSSSNNNNSNGDFVSRPSFAAWHRFELDPRIMRALHDLKFTQPTPIQEACIPPATQHYKSVIGAAQTGSGKTLAFGIPIVQRLLQERARDDAKRARSNNSSSSSSSSTAGDGEEALPPQQLRALILTPTRELALQVSKHLRALAKYASDIVSVCEIIGGMSVQKQNRLLGKRPSIIVATPGRLWELVEQGNEHLQDMSALSFFVLDEADRMISTGHFPELQTLIAFMHSFDQERTAAATLLQDEFAFGGVDADGNLINTDNVMQDEEASGGDDDLSALDSEASDYEEQLEQRRALRRAAQKQKRLLEKQRKKKLAVQLRKRSKQTRGRRQTFLFSATMMLVAQGREERFGSAKSKKKRRAIAAAMDQHSMLDQLVETLELQERPVVVDLSTANKMASRLDEFRIDCVDANKDDAAYYFCLQHPGKTLMFVNTISNVRRLASIFAVLKMNCWPLHAKMQQRQRLKNLDRFKASRNGIIICTDVAARGLDIPDVEYVLHHQVPRSSEIYIHRAGRTARAQRSGTSILFVTPRVRHHVPRAVSRHGHRRVPD